MPERITFQQKSMLPGIKAPGRSDEAAEIRRTSVDIAILRDTRSIIVRSLPARGNLACPGTDVTGPIRPERCYVLFVWNEARSRSIYQVAIRRDM